MVYKLDVKKFNPFQRGGNTKLVTARLRRDRRRTRPQYQTLQVGCDMSGRSLMNTGGTNFFPRCVTAEAQNGSTAKRPSAAVVAPLLTFCCGDGFILSKKSHNRLSKKKRKSTLQHCLTCLMLLSFLAVFATSQKCSQCHRWSPWK